MLKKICLFSLFFFLSIFMGCNSGVSDFQQNDPSARFQLFSMFDGYPSLEELWNSIDGSAVDTRLSDTINHNRGDFVTFSYLQADVMGAPNNPTKKTVINIKDILGQIMDSTDVLNRKDGIGEYYSHSASNYRDNFYAVLDKITEGDILADDSVTNDIMGLLGKGVDWVGDKSAVEIRDFMQDLADSSSEMSRDDFISMSKIISKTLLRSDYPMWLDSGDGSVITDISTIDFDPITGDFNSDLGNLVKGLDLLISSGLKMISDDSVIGDYLYDILRENGKMMDVSLGTVEEDGKTVPVDTKYVTKKLLQNIEDYFTKDGEHYTGDYNTDNSEIYSVAEIGNSIKELFPALQKLLITSKGDWEDERMPDFSLFKDSKGRSVLDIFLTKLQNLGWTDDYIDSLDFDSDAVNMILYDGFGRKRINDDGTPNPNASDVSYLDHTLFTLLGASTFGFQDSRSSSGDGADNFGHGHGAPTGGMITLNDCLFNQGVYDSGIAVIAPNLQTYSLALEKNQNHTGDAPGEKTFRSSTLFDANSSSAYKFYLKPSYPANLMLAGQSVGDGGIPNGGKPIPEGNLGSAYKSFINYWPMEKNGIGEQNVSRWSMGWIARACWEGEGPYYYKNRNAEQVNIDGKIYYKYLRPNGAVYAYVHKADESDSTTWDYIYANDSSVDATEGAELYLGKPNWAEFITDGARSYHSTSYAWSDHMKFRVRVGTQSEKTVDVASSGMFDGYCGLRAGFEKEKIVSGFQNLGLGIVISIAQDGSCTDTKKYKIGAPGPIAITNMDGDLVSTTDLYSIIWKTDTYNAGTYHSVFIPETKYKITKASKIAIKVNRQDTVYIDLEARVYAKSEIISLLNNALSGKATVQNLGRNLSDSNQPVYVVPKSRDNFHSNSYYSNYLKHDAPTDDGIKIVALDSDPDTADSLYGKIEVSLDSTTPEGTAMQDLFGANIGSSSIVAHTGRSNRYHEKWHSDYYMYKVDSNYYAPGNWAGTSDSSLKGGVYWYNEKISEKSDLRECSSQEEAMFRNYQWLMQEKKIVYVIPILINHSMAGTTLKYLVSCKIEANGIGGLINAKKYSTSFSDNRRWTKDGGYDDSIIPSDGRIDADVIEISAAPVLGIPVASKDMIFGSLGNGTVLPPVIGYNMAPVERMGFILEKTDNPRNEYEINSYDIGPDKTYWAKRTKTFPIIASLMGTLHEVSFYDPPESYKTDPSTNTNYDLNISEKNKYPLKILTDALIPALAKPMFYYQKNAGHNPNNSWKPRVAGTSSDFGSWFGNTEAFLKPPVNQDNNWVIGNNKEATLSKYLPKYYKTLAGMLFESDVKKINGMVPLTAKTKMTTILIKLLNRLGKDGNGSIYGDNSSGSLSDISNWGIRRKMFYGLEQILTSFRVTKGEVYTRGYIDAPLDNWQFATDTGTVDADGDEIYSGVRDVDIVIDEFVDGLADLIGFIPDNAYVYEKLNNSGVDVSDILKNKDDGIHPGTIKIVVDGTILGSDSDNGDGTGAVTGTGISGSGIVNYLTGAISFTLIDDPDKKSVRCNYNNQDWKAFDDSVDDMKDFLAPSGNNYIVEDLITILDKLSFDADITEYDVETMLYNIGKLFAYYDSNAGRWVYQGEIGFDSMYKLATSFPEMHNLMKDSTGANYKATVNVLSYMLKKGGIVQEVIDDAAIPSYGFEDIFNDLYSWMDSEEVTGDNAAMWPVMAKLMRDMATGITESPSMDELHELFEEYGFQYNFRQ